MKETFALQKDRLGVATAAVAIVVVVIVLVAGVGAYLAFSKSPSSSTITTSSSKASVVGTISTSSITSSTTHISSTQSSLKSSTTASGETMYSGTFNFTLPLEGPSGVRDFSNGTFQEYNTTQVASGTFTFSLAAGGLSGSGSGKGTMTATTTGFCSGQNIFSYTFQIPDVTTEFGNLTVFFGTPTPSSFMVSLACTGPMQGVDTSVNEPTQFLAVYPNEINLQFNDLSVYQHLQGGIVYGITITQTS